MNAWVYDVEVVHLIWVAVPHLYVGYMYQSLEANLPGANFSIPRTLSGAQAI